MSKKEITQLIDNYFHNRITAEEVEEALKGLSDIRNVNEVENLMTKHWEESAKSRTEDKAGFDSLLNKIHHRINIIKQESKILLPEATSIRGKKPAPIKLITKYLSKAAAILFLPLLLTFAYYLLFESKEIRTEQTISYNEVYTPLSAKTKLILPDSTVVWLNSGSRLKYPFIFQNKSREVFLSGEGYFEVASNEKIPFVVKTDELDIIAYGTSFNVMAYSDDKTIETTLVEGKVEVEETRTKCSVDLEPSCQSVFHRATGKQVTEKVDTKFYTSWKDGRLIFRDEPITDVIRKLERWFNCTIILEDNVLKDYRYTGNIEMEKLTEVVDLIGITTPVDYIYNKETREIRIRSK